MAATPLFLQYSLLSLHTAQQPLCPSSLKPPAAGNESIHKLLCSERIARCAVWEYWHYAMHFIIPGCPGMMRLCIPNSREWKNRPGNANPSTQGVLMYAVQHSRNLKLVHKNNAIRVWPTLLIKTKIKSTGSLRLYL